MKARGAIREFIDANGRIDHHGWQQDLAQRFMTDYVGSGNAVRTRDLYRLYFGKGPEDFELLTDLGQQIQIARARLEEAGVFLINDARLWYCIPAEDWRAARQFIRSRALRMTRAHRRIMTYSKTGHETYALPSGDPLLRALADLQSRMRRVEGTLDTPLPPGEEDAG